MINLLGIKRLTRRRKSPMLESVDRLVRDDLRRERARLDQGYNEAMKELCAQIVEEVRRGM